ncbi:cytochrome c [Ideonella sp. A 288]|uniref:c-type cytochrome n=1 Tax=Ideonella sp. A 288 TaxID=1962181 RepID=UPI000B4A651C|nr:c-type cytochrome [Ideonella sp. A 288]
MKSLLALTLLTALLAPAFGADAPAAAKPDLAKGQEKAQMCAACHTSDGSRGTPANPILAGQHADYLVKQLTEFKAGKRANPIMSGMAATLTDEDMRNVAAFYSSKQAKPGAAKNADTVTLGEKIYRGGIAAKQVPACAGCHSPTGAGIPAQYPRLAGQHAEYTEAQLVSFRAGQRGNSAQMVSIAARMSDKEIKAVADYMAGLN